MKTLFLSKKTVKLPVIVAPLLLILGFSFREKSGSIPELLPVLSNVDKLVEEEMIKQNIVGCAVGVVQNGVIVHVKGYGHHDLLRTKPVTASLVFRWASVSKPLTAVAAFKAIELNKLHLDDKVTAHVSYWPNSGNKRDITVRNLLNNRSGINHYRSGGYTRSKYTAKNNFNASQCVSVFSSASLDFDPGIQYQYSTFGFNLLGAVVEEAAKEPYEKFIKKHIADKAGMVSLTAYAGDPKGFGKDCNGVLSSTSEGDVEWKLPGGGWSSNINDMAKFVGGLINGTFLTNTAALWQSVPDNSGYAFGISRGSLNGELYISHGGAHDDVRTELAFFPSSRLGVVVMVNGNGYVSADRLCKKIQKLFGKNWNLDDLPRNYCGTNKDCGDKMAGVWRKTDNTENTVIRRGYSNDAFNAEWKWLTARGYYCADFETYVKGSSRKWDGIFKKGNKRSAMWRNWSQDGFHNKWVEMSNSGLRLIDVETYVDGSTRKWAGLFLEMTGGYALHRNMSQDGLNAKWKEYGSRGLKLIDIERYGNNLWAGVWVTGANVAMYRNWNTEDFKQLRRDNNEKGWKLIDVDTYMDGSTRKWSGLWEKTTVPEKYLYGFSHCDWLSTYHTDYAKEGYELIDMEVY
ncbi:MAG: serine hydrolase domain-containing protein [Niabella sp.]